MPENGRRKRGRPKKTWRCTFKEDLEEMDVSWHGARRIASDRDLSSPDAPRGTGGTKCNKRVLTGWSQTGHCWGVLLSGWTAPRCLPSHLGAASVAAGSCYSECSVDRCHLRPENKQNMRERKTLSFLPIL